MVGEADRRGTYEERKRAAIHQITDFKYHLVNQAFVDRIKPHIPGDILIDLQDRMHQAKGLDLILYYIMFEYRGQVAYSYQMINPDMIADNPTHSIEQMLKPMVQDWAEENYKERRQNGKNNGSAD